MRAIILLCGFSFAAAQGPENSVIRSGVPWFDTNGNRVYAGGANLYAENGVYWLVGEGKYVWRKPARTQHRAHALTHTLIPT